MSDSRIHARFLAVLAPILVAGAAAAETLPPVLGPGHGTAQRAVRPAAEVRQSHPAPNQPLRVREAQIAEPPVAVAPLRKTPRPAAPPDPNAPPSERQPPLLGTPGHQFRPNLRVVEEGKFQRRLARIERLEAIARETNNGHLAAMMVRIRSKAEGYHDRMMARLPAQPAVAPPQMRGLP